MITNRAAADRTTSKAAEDLLNICLGAVRTVCLLLAAFIYLVNNALNSATQHGIVMLSIAVKAIDYYQRTGLIFRKKTMMPGSWDDEE